MGDVELSALAAQREGHVTRPQARAHLSGEQLEYRLTTRGLVPLAPSVV